MTQTGIPFVFMRGGTSRGPYVNRADLPEDRAILADVLVAMVGSGHPLNIDGLGGGATVTTKVAILSPSDDAWADVDYFFAQVSVEDRLVDFKPTCGNILVGVGPAAIEMGIVPTRGEVTDVNIRAVNTGARVTASIKTPRGAIAYEGETAIDGVPGTASPIGLRFMDVVGGVTGSLFPTGHRQDTIEGITVSCMDVAMPMVIARADDFGLTGYEGAAELDDNAAFLARMEAVRLVAGERMGMGEVGKSVTPKFGLLAPAREGGSATVRYFTPWSCHPTVAVTGSQCLAACLLADGTIGVGLMSRRPEAPAKVVLEHPMGKMDVLVEYTQDDTDFTVTSAGLERTARKIAQGSVFVPPSVWPGN
ncbi:MAG: 4-oxalomesaconate tautomerase [Pseudomonadota bacterium]